MKKKPTFSGSQIPGIIECPQSRIKPKIKIDSSGEPARIGNAVHELIAKRIDTYENPDIEKICLKHDVKRDDVAPLYFRALSAWRDIGDSLASPIVESRMSADLGKYTLSGKPDAMAIIEEHDALFILDWKTGRLEEDARNQIKAYLLIALLNGVYGGRDFTSYIGRVYHLRQSYAETIVLTKEDLRDFRETLDMAIVGRNKDTYNPGKACQYCNRAHECKAGTALIKLTVGSLTNGEYDSLTPAVVSDIWYSIDKIEKLCKAFKSSAKELVSEHGPISVSRTHEVSIRGENNAEFDMGKVRAVLGDDIFFAACKLTKTGLSAALKEAGISAKDMFNALLESGAMKYIIKPKFKARRKERAT